MTENPKTTPSEVSPPLTPIVFEILLSLVEDARHGYAIMRQVEERTGGRIRLLPGTLYRAVHRLIEEGLIEEADQPPDAESDDQRRIYYRLTDSGLEAAEAEAERLAATLSFARAKNLLRGEGQS